MKNNDTKYCILENDNPKVALCVCKHHPCHKQVPENFEELKKLVSDNMKVFNKQVKKIEISTFMIEIHFKLQTFVFLHNGNIVEPNCLRPIVKRTPEQMWNIIKNLTEK